MAMCKMFSVYSRVVEMLSFSINYIIVFMVLSRTTMGDNTMEFFNLDPKDLTVLTWSHGTNSKSLLKNATEDTINMIEADVSLGKIIGTLEIIPILAHPPIVVSDLSLEALLEAVIDHNKLASNAKNKKGVKLDFKNIIAFNRSIEILEKYRGQITFPLWINADILSGPTIKDIVIPLDPEKFLPLAQKVKYTVLSVGWTTLMGLKKIIPYKENDIANMKAILNKFNITDNVTFPVRAAAAALSINEMVNLVKSFHEATLTIWSPEDDNVNVTLLNQLVKNDVGKDKCYTDLPKPLI